MEGFLLAMAVGAGADPRRVAVLALSLRYPWAVLAVGGITAWGATKGTDSRPARFCEGVSSELRAGSTLRQALSASALAVGSPAIARQAMAGVIDDVAAAVASEFIVVGREIELTIRRAWRVGGSTADLFDEMAALAIAEEELRREIRVAAAPARAAAAIFLVAPVVFLIMRVSSGDLAALLRSPEQRMVATAGIAMLLGGLVSAGFVMKRAR